MSNNQLIYNTTNFDVINTVNESVLINQNSTHDHNSSYILDLLKLIRSKVNRPLNSEEVFRNVLIICFYSLIVFISLSGNVLVSKVIIFGKPKMKTTTNILIASLAFSDLLVTSLNIPFNVARLLLHSWPFGSTLCFLVPFVQVTCVYVSTFTMTVIALHRWWTLSRSTTASNKLSSLKLGIIIATVWSLAGVLSVPHSIFNQIVQIPHDPNLVRCRVVYPKMEMNFSLMLSVEAFLTQYIIPLSITCILYIKIGLVVSAQGQMALRSDDERRRRQSEAKRKRMMMLILVVTMFAICWLPLNLYHLLVDFGIINYKSNVFLVCHWFAMSSVCYNPFIYCWLNSSFRKGGRKAFRTLLLCFGKKQQITEAITTDIVTENATQNITRVSSIEDNTGHNGHKDLVVKIQMNEIAAES